MKRMILTLTAASVMAAFGLQAQTPTPKEGEIAQRKDNQQKRIGQGVANGKLTPKETVQLENKQAKLNKEIHTERKANGGNLTTNEKKQINRQQNKMSKKIYTEKHDGPAK